MQSLQVRLACLRQMRGVNIVIVARGKRYQRPVRNKRSCNGCEVNVDPAIQSHNSSSSSSNHNPARPFRFPILTPVTATLIRARAETHSHGHAAL